jgi:branched-chain amino acid transport system ATP-binding protein
MKVLQSGPPHLAIVDLSVSLHTSPILTAVSLAVHKQQIVAIVGPNGAGKTTLLKTVAGLIPAVGGRICLAGESIRGLDVWEIVRRGLVYVPEGFKVFPQMSVLENLEVGAYLHRSRLAEQLETVYRLFPELRERAKASAGILSGGQQRMVTLARGLMSGADVLLLDDPFLGLSPKLVKRFCAVFRMLRKKGMTLVIAGQHVRRILNVADLAYLLEDGHVTLSGPGPDVLHNPHLRASLLGAEP